ncbi:MAG: hypothetical protein HY682_01920 [Chloroflexi bacterium]|nr:hypothetical protein [Chloroflexota bacterium]
MTARSSPGKSDPRSTLFARIEETVRIAEDFVRPPSDSWAAALIYDDVLPGLFQARMYVELGHFRAPEVRDGLFMALQAAHKLTDGDPRYIKLVNRLRILLEEAEFARRAD